MPTNKRTPDNWTNETKLATVIETSQLSEAELSEYCRNKGLYVEKIKAWRTYALKGFSSRQIENISSSYS